MLKMANQNSNQENKAKNSQPNLTSDQIKEIVRQQNFARQKKKFEDIRKIK